MTDYMLTVWSRDTGGRDVQVNDAPDMRSAIEVAEKHTGCRVDHGRGGIGSLFDPALVIDYASGEIEVRHDRAAEHSMQIINVFKEPVSIKRGEGK